MIVVCKMAAYDLVTGEKRFTRGSTYIAEYRNDTIISLDDKGEWSTISTKMGTSDLLKNDTFKLHFQVSTDNNKQIS